MLYECNKPRFLFLKYGPLLFSLIFSSGIFTVITDKDPNIPLGIFIAIISGLLFMLFIFTRNRVKFVSIGTTKLVVKEAHGSREYSWLDVESISLDRILGIYTLHLRNAKAIYFPPYGGATWLFGDQSEMGAIISKMKKELDI
jgi:hypothetical protein